MFCNQLPELLKSLIGNRNLNEIRLFAQDESRFGLLPVLRRRITLKGVKPVQPIQHVFENYYLYGAIEPKSGNSFFLEMPYLNSDCFQIFLDQISLHFPDTLNILILDNGAFHKAKKLNIANNLILLFLPPYAPELNPIERFWLDVKDQIAGEIFETLLALKDSVAKIIRSYSNEEAAKLTGFPYILNAINAQLI